MPHFIVKLCDGRTEKIQFADNANSDEELLAFLEQRGSYEGRWIKLASGEHIRYDQIASVKVSV